MTTQPATSQYTTIINEICIRLTERADGDYNTRAVHIGLDDLANADPDDLILRALADGCGYSLLYEGNEAVFAHGPFAPFLVVPRDDGTLDVYPTPLDQVGQEVLDLWSACASDESLNPLVRSRLADLLWVRKQKQRPPWFEVAVKTYMDFAEATDETLDREQALTRAIAICKATNRRELMVGPLEMLAGLARESIDSSDSLYGVVARALEALVLNDHRCSDLIADAIKKYDADPYEISGLREIAIIASKDDEDKLRMQRERVDAFEAAAKRSSGLLRVSRLREAQAIAHDARLDQEVKRLTLEIEHIDLEDEWIRIETTIEIGTDEVHSFVDHVVGPYPLVEALLRFSVSVPINNPDETKAAIEETEGQFPLQTLMSKFIVGPNNSITQIPSGDPKRMDVAMSERDALSIDLFSSIFGRAVLQAIHEQHEPDCQDMANCFSGAVPSEVATRIAISYRHWVAQDFDSAVCVIVSTLEPIVRHICSSFGINVTDTGGRAVHNSEIRSLGPMLDDLEPHIGALQARYLKAALVDRLSLNLRNLLAHGLVPKMTEAQYITLFHIACVLRRIAEFGAGADGDPESHPEL